MFIKRACVGSTNPHKHGRDRLIYRVNTSTGHLFLILLIDISFQLLSNSSEKKVYVCVCVWSESSKKAIE